MKMGKKVKEYKSGDFIFAKVKGYPAWPARVQRLNGKKYFVYFYGTGETANLPPNMIFDYAENKDKFLTKTVKRRDFNDGVKQIEHDFANNVPLEQVIGGAIEPPAESANDSAIDTANETADDSAMDTTTADDTVADTTTNTTQNETAVEDSDDAGALVIDEGKQQAQKTRKSAAVATPKTPKVTRKAKKDEEEDKEEKQEELVSRSGRKIRPKRYMDEQTEDNATLPSPAPKKRRGSPTPTNTQTDKEKSVEKTVKQYNNVSQSELEDLKEPFKPADPEKDNILIVYLPVGQYAGIKLWESKPNSFKNNAAKLQWERQAAANAITLKMQLEKGQIKPQAVAAQLVMDLNLTEEEKAALDKERETEEKKSRVQFLKTEMRLIELDAKIKTCLCLEKADTDSCLQLLDQLAQLELRPLMLLKHPACLETVKRLRAYVGNTPHWHLSDADAALFNRHAHKIRKQADTLYKNMKELFSPVATLGAGGELSFWELFTGRVQALKQLTAHMSADDLLEMVHEPPQLSDPTSLTMQTAVEAANQQEAAELNDKPTPKPAKTKKSNTPAKTPSKRGRKQEEKEKEKEIKEKENDKNEKEAEDTQKIVEVTKSTEESKEVDESENNVDGGAEVTDGNTEDTENVNDKEVVAEEKESSNEKEKEVKSDKESNKKDKDSERKDKATEKKEKELEKKDKEAEKKDKESEKKDKEIEKKEKDSEKKDKDSEKTEKKDKESEKKDKESEKKDKESEKKDKESEKKDKESEKKDKEVEKEKEDEPRAKRSRGESKKTDPPPRSPAKRKPKA